MESPIAALKEQFRKVFGAGETVHVIRAPGRVNLIGEHTDYNDGFVCPMAIEAQVLFACRARQDALVRITSPEFDRGISEFSVGKKIERGTPAWSNYCRGVAAALVGEGVPLCGMDLLISSTLPVGGGLSSSAALEVGTALCFLNLAGRAMEQMPLALLCQKAEHEYALVPCGIMDQTIVVAAQAGAAMLLDCRRLTTGAVPIDAADLRVVIVNSMVKHELASGEYAVRRRQCQAAVAFFQKENPAIKALRDVTLKDLEGARGRLDDLTLRRARHVVTENLRTVQAAACLGQRKYQQAGELMVQSHLSMRDDYQITCPQIDLLVEEAMKIPGVYGARMTGGGFGGCIVALSQPLSVEAMGQRLKTAYTAKFGLQPQIYVTTAAPGASVVE